MKIEFVKRLSVTTAAIVCFAISGSIAVGSDPLDGYVKVSLADACDGKPFYLFNTTAKKWVDGRRGSNLFSGKIHLVDSDPRPFVLKGGSIKINDVTVRQDVSAVLQSAGQSDVLYSKAKAGDVNWTRKHAGGHDAVRFYEGKNAVSIEFTSRRELFRYYYLHVKDKNRDAGLITRWYSRDAVSSGLVANEWTFHRKK